MYVIRGKYSNCAWEDIDEFDTREEAEKMLAKYRVAFGFEWLLTIKKRKTLAECEKVTGKEGVVNTHEEAKSALS